MTWCVIFVLLVAACPAGAVCHVVRPAGSGGSNNGNDWNNAFLGLPATLVRGDVYYVADGTYNSYRFNTAESGTTLITIKKAIASDHCTDTGWVLGTMGSGQAVWNTTGGPTNQIWQVTDNGYYTMDGQVRTDLHSGYGFKLDNSSATKSIPLDIEGCGPGTSCSPIISGVTVRFTEIAGGGVHSNNGDSYSIVSVSRNSAGTQSTIVTSANARFLANSSTVVGSQMSITGIADNSFNNANARCTATSDQTHFTYDNVGTANASSTGGTVTGALKFGEFDLQYSGRQNNLLFDRIYIHDSSDTPIQSHGQSSNVTIQYSVIARNNSSGAYHSEAYADQKSNASDSIDPNGVTIIRYNVWEDIEGTAYLACVSTGGLSCHNLDVYGNVFMTHSGNPYRRIGLGNGVIATTSNSIASNWNVYNNSFINLSALSMLSTTNITSGTGFTAYNNICYSPGGVSCTFPQSGGSPITHNWTWCGTTGSCPNDTNIQTGSSSPFVDWVNENYHLAAATNAGTTLASPYNTDPDGVTRGADGTWDRGAFEFGGSSCSPVISSVTLNPTSVVGGNTSTGTVTISCAPSSNTSVSLSSNNTAVATVPTTVTVLANQTTANFTVTTVSVCTSTNVTITATLGGSTTASLMVTAGGGQCQGANVIGTAKVMGTAVVQ